MNKDNYFKVRWFCLDAGGGWRFFLWRDPEMCVRAKLVTIELMQENKILQIENKELMKEIQKLIDMDDK